MERNLAGRYRLERQLGKGGMGSVWVAEHLALRSRVAVKLMDPAIAATPEGAERFRREAQAAASLRSAHVVQVLDYGVDQDTPFLVMELLEGETLASCLEREKRLTSERTLAIVTQVSRALTRAHGASIVHRDLKPENVFLVREDDQELVKLLDFGIAKTPNLQFGGAETKTGVALGTPYYMSPEQVQGKKVDARTDLWALGVIACECLTGVRPFEGASLAEIVYNICVRPIVAPSSYGLSLPGFDEWYAKATHRDPDQRFGSAQEQAASLRDVMARGVAGEGEGHRPVDTGSGFTAVPGLPRHGRRHLVFALVALAVAGVIAAWVRSSAKPSGSPTAATSESRPPSEPAPTSAAVVPPSIPSMESNAPGLRQHRATSSASSHGTLPAGGAARPREPAGAAVPPSMDSPPAAWNEPSREPSAAETKGGAEPTAGSTRCFLDPFSGRVRLAGARTPAGASTFACKQDPFTGQYRRE